MSFSSNDRVGRGLILGSWGAAQALGAGLGIAIGGILRDIINKFALSGAFGTTFESDATGYLFVYHLEILIIFITLIALGSLSQELNKKNIVNNKDNRFGLAEIPS
jgi:BCD family chlorophyll transporter-like MFS transporter